MTRRDDAPQRRVQRRARRNADMEAAMQAMAADETLSPAGREIAERNLRRLRAQRPTSPPETGPHA